VAAGTCGIRPQTAVEVLRLAEERASELIDAARAEAARITASDGAAPSAPVSGSGLDDRADDHLGG